MSTIDPRTLTVLRLHGEEIEAIAQEHGYRPGRPPGASWLRLRSGCTERVARKALKLVRSKEWREVVTSAPEAPSAPLGPVSATQTNSPKVESTPNPDGTLTVTVKGKAIKTLDDLMEAAQVDREQWRVESWVANTWTTTMGDKTGEADAVQVGNWQVKARLSRRLDCDVVPVQGEPLPMKPRATKPATRTIVALPDTQIGFLWTDNRDGLRAMHDREAMDAAVRGVRELDPDVVVLLGDFLDLAEVSKYQSASELRQTIQPSILEGYWWLRRIREAAPHARIVMTWGNHDVRALTHAVGAGVETIRAATDTRPALDLARLLDLDSLGIESVAYGDSIWIDGIEFSHDVGHHKDPGGLVTKQLRDRHHSLVTGHDHKAAIAHKVVEGPEGRRPIFAMNPGCLASVKPGLVPAASSRITWTQSIGVIRQTGGQSFGSLAPIVEGVLVLDGEVIQGSDPAPEIAEWSGWPAIARGA